MLVTPCTRPNRTARSTCKNQRVKEPRVSAQSSLVRLVATEELRKCDSPRSTQSLVWLYWTVALTVPDPVFEMDRADPHRVNVLRLLCFCGVQLIPNSMIWADGPTAC